MVDEVEIECLEPFKILYDLPADTNIIILIGGRGGSKTYEASKWIAVQSTIKQKRCAVLRDEKSLIRESILNEVLMRYDTANENGVFDKYYQKLETGIKDKASGEMLVFTKGFRASNTEKRANLKSISNVDYAIIEEAEDIRDVTKFNTFSDSIRKEGSVIVVILNTPDIQHWIVKRYFNLEQVEDGFYKLSPKNIPGLVVVFTTHLDNPYLPERVRQSYEGYGDPSSHLYDKFHYMTAIKGYASTGRKGQIITKAKPITLKEYLELPYKEIYGQDFGTASPAGLIGVKFYKNNCYTRQLNYLPKTPLQIGIMYCEFGFGSNDKIIADHADKNACDKLEDGFTTQDTTKEILESHPQLTKGFYIVRCIKGDDAVRFRLGLINSLNLFVCEESTDYWNEILNYCYAQDKYGNYTSDPIDDYNHLIDPLGYIVHDRSVNLPSAKPKTTLPEAKRTKPEVSRRMYADLIKKN